MCENFIFIVISRIVIVIIIALQEECKNRNSKEDIVPKSRIKTSSTQLISDARRINSILLSEDEQCSRMVESSLFAPELVSLSFALQNVSYTDVGAGNEAQNTEGNDDNVLPQPPIPLSQTVLEFPDGHQLDHRRKHETQSGQTHSSNEGDERAQIGDCDCHANGEDHQQDTEKVFAEQSPRAEVLLRILPNNLHGHVKLESVSEKDCYGDHHFGGLRQYFVLRGIKCYRGLCVLAVSPVTEETDGAVQQYDDKHAGVEHTRATDKVQWCLHVILQRHNLKDRYYRLDNQLLYIRKWMKVEGTFSDI